MANDSGDCPNMEMLEAMQNMTGSFRVPEYRDNVTSEVLCGVCESYILSLGLCVDLCAHHVTSAESQATPGDAPDPLCVELATEGARCLRNVCAGCYRNQNIIFSHTTEDASRNGESYLSCVITSLSLLLGDQLDDPQIKSLPHSLRDKVILLLRCSAQMLGNVASSNGEVSKALATTTFYRLLRQLLCVGDLQLSNYTCYLLHGCLLADKSGHMTQLVETPGGIEIMDTILDFLKNPECKSEWGLYIMEISLSHSGLMPLLKPSLIHRSWLLVLDIILTQLEKSEAPATTNQEGDNRDNCVAIETIEYIGNQYTDDSYKILGLKPGDPETEAEAVCRYVSILCAATCCQYYTKVKDNQTLLQTTINLLQCLCELGRSGENIFTPVGRVADLENVDTSHPACGIKRDLIRLIANMAHTHRQNQDKVREWGGLQLILDNTNIDGRNPFITQWAIFAIRNLLDGNHDNKEVIARMRIQGLSDNVDQLREYGVEAELDGDAVVIRNVDKDLVSPFTRPSGGR